MEELLSLKWNNHRSTFLHILSVLRDKQLYTDATLACDGKFYSVHRLVLSTCSDYFSAMFDRTNTCKNPIIVLKDIKCEDLEALLDYMYLGEVNVKQADLASLIKAAECLRVKGLAVPDDEPPTKKSKGDSNNSKRPDTNISPTSRRKKRDESHDRKQSTKSPQVSNNVQSQNSTIRPEPSSDIASETETAFIKTEKTEDSDEVGIVEAFDNTDMLKEEIETSDAGDPGESADDIPDFMQQGDSGSYDANFPGTSYDDDINWQDDGSDLNFADQGNFNSDLSQNAQGIDHGEQRTNMNLLNTEMSCKNFCTMCDKIFATPSALVRHRRIHTGEKPYSCSLCDYKSNQKDNLKGHILRKHPFSW